MGKFNQEDHKKNLDGNRSTLEFFLVSTLIFLFESNDIKFSIFTKNKCKKFQLKNNLNEPVFVAENMVF